MSGMIPPEIVDQVRNACDIVDVIGSQVSLKKRGQNFIGLSPFQKEKTPSFNVNPQRQIFKCFSSGHGGDVFKFLMLMENMTFPEAVRRLAQRAGIVIPEGANYDPAVRTQREELLALNAAIATWWQKLLHSDPAAEPARAYLKSRDFPSALADEFGLGYAPEGWDSTLKWAQKNGHSMQALEAGRLVATSDSGRTYDFFRGRLMIPIYNDSGEVVAFSGRLLDPDAKAQKYVNSHETPVFIKSKILFGLNKSKRAIIEAGSAIVCEGQIDLMRCWQKGIHNIVASQGTAFTDQHARILKRLAKEVVICFDADRAGQNASLKSIDVLLKEDVQVRIARIPQGEDPDSLLRKQPVEVFQSILHDAKDYAIHLLDTTFETEDVLSPRGRGAAAQKMAHIIAKIPNAVQRDGIILRVANRLQVSVATLSEEIFKVEAQAQAQARRPFNDPQRHNLGTPEGEMSADGIAETPQEPLQPDALIERMLLLLLKNPELTPEVSRQLNPTWTEGLAGSEVLLDLMESHAHDEWHEAPEYLQKCDERTKDYLAGLLLNASANMFSYTQEEDSNYQGGETGKLQTQQWAMKNKNSKLAEQNTPEMNANLLVSNIEKRWKQQRFQILTLATKSSELSIEERLKYLMEIQAIRRQFPDLNP